MNQVTTPFVFIKFFLFKLRLKFFGNLLSKKADWKKEKKFIAHSKYGFDLHLNILYDVDKYFYLGTFENETIRIYRKLLKPGMTVFDVGANIGIFSLIAATKSGDTGKVYAFEPAERVYEQFQKNIQLNGFKNIFLQQKGISNKTEVLSFHLCEDDAYNSFGEKPMRAVVRTIPVDVTSIDEFCFEKQIKKIDILKIDVEGAEYKVLEGGKNLLSRKEGPVIFCEYNRNIQDKNGLNQLENLLKNYEYELYFLRFGLMKKFNGQSEAHDIIAVKHDQLYNL